MKIWEGFLEEVPIKDEQSGSLALSASGTRRNKTRMHNKARYFLDSPGLQKQASVGQKDTNLRRAGCQKEPGWVHRAVIPCVSKSTVPLVMKL